MPKLQALEGQFRMPSDVFYQISHLGEVEDEEEFFAGMSCRSCGNVFSSVCPFCKTHKLSV